VPIRALQFAIADTFVRHHVRRSSDTKAKLYSGAIRMACSRWCEMNVLPIPSPRELAHAMRQLGCSAGKSNGLRVWRGAVWGTTHDEFVVMAHRDVLRRLMRYQPMIPIVTFCQLVGIARSTFYEMYKRGATPSTTRLGKRRYIRCMEALEWCQSNERHGALLNIIDWFDAVTKPTRRRVPALLCVADLTSIQAAHSQNRTQTGRERPPSSPQRAKNQDHQEGLPVCR